MDIKTELLKDHSRRTADRIVAWIGADAQRFRILMELFLKGEYLVTQRAATAVGICTDRYPALAGPYVGRMLARMEQPGVHIAVRRTVVRMLQHVEIPVGLLGRVATLCFAYLASPDSPVAVMENTLTATGESGEARYAKQSVATLREPTGISTC